MTGSIEVSEEGTALIIAIRGELDLATRVSVERALSAAPASAGSIVIDLEGLTFCDSSGLGALVAAHEAATASGSRFVIRRASPAVRRLFAISGVDQTIELVP
jgi:anti-sigma B factor antagonist